MTDHHLEKLRERRLKLTPKRRAIVEVFRREGRHLTPDEVWRCLRRQFRRCGLPGVYRNLETLAGCGVLVKIHRPDRRRCYGLCTAGEPRHHHHIVCVDCGAVGELAGCGLPPLRTVNGFRVLRHFVQLEGLCAECRKAPRRLPAAGSGRRKS